MRNSELNIRVQVTVKLSILTDNSAFRIPNSELNIRVRGYGTLQPLRRQLPFQGRLLGMGYGVALAY